LASYFPARLIVPLPPALAHLLVAGGGDVIALTIPTSILEGERRCTQPHSAEVFPTHNFIIDDNMRGTPRFAYFFNLIRNEPVSVRSDKAGYHRATATLEARKQLHFFIASVVMWLAHPEGSSGLEVDHKDRARGNNHPDNLRYATRREQGLNRVLPPRKPRVLYDAELRRKHEAHLVYFKHYTDRRGKKVVLRHGVWVSAIGDIILNVSKRHVRSICDSGAYPVLAIDGKLMAAHLVQWRTHHPDEIPPQVVEHIKDDRSKWGIADLAAGTHSSNSRSAYANGRYDGTKSARQAVVLVNTIDGVEAWFPSQTAAAPMVIAKSGFDFRTASSGISQAIRKGCRVGVFKARRATAEETAAALAAGRG
jgi:hypothetical protein